MGDSCPCVVFLYRTDGACSFMGDLMEGIAKLLREAYKLIQEADTTDIDAFYLAVEEAQGFIAEALDIADNK